MQMLKVLGSLALVAILAAQQLSAGNLIDSVIDAPWPWVPAAWNPIEPVSLTFLGVCLLSLAGALRAKRIRHRSSRPVRPGVRNPSLAPGRSPVA